MFPPPSCHPTLPEATGTVEHVRHQKLHSSSLQPTVRHLSEPRPSGPTPPTPFPSHDLSTPTATSGPCPDLRSDPLHTHHELYDRLLPNPSILKSSLLLFPFPIRTPGSLTLRTPSGPTSPIRGHPGRRVKEGRLGKSVSGSTTPDGRGRRSPGSPWGPSRRRGESEGLPAPVVPRPPGRGPLLRLPQGRLDQGPAHRVPDTGRPLGRPHVPDTGP